MELAVKERLVGAAVLMAAAIILIPEMLSGPEREQRGTGQPAAEQGDLPLKTYTIDLNQSPGARMPAGGGENRAPPHEKLARPAATERPAADAQLTPAAPPEPTPAASSPLTSAANSAVEPPVARVPAALPAARPLAPAVDVPPSGGWAVQLGSFSKQETAERLVKQLRAQGQDAFVMPVKSGAATLYRVRIGPVQDKVSADAVLRTVKATVPGAAVVTHP